MKYGDAHIQVGIIYYSYNYIIISMSAKTVYNISIEGPNHLLMCALVPSSLDLPGLGCLLVGLVTMVSVMYRIQELPASMS